MVKTHNNRKSKNKITLSNEWLAVLISAYPPGFFPIQHGEVIDPYDAFFMPMPTIHTPRKEIKIQQVVWVNNRLTEQTRADFGFRDNTRFMLALAKLPSLTNALHYMIKKIDNSAKPPITEISADAITTQSCIKPQKLYVVKHHQSALIDRLQARLNETILAYQPAKLFFIFETEAGREKAKQRNSLATTFCNQRYTSLDSMRKALKQWQSKNKSFTQSRRLNPLWKSSTCKSAQLFAQIEKRLDQAFSLRDGVDAS